MTSQFKSPIFTFNYPTTSNTSTPTTSDPPTPIISNPYTTTITNPSTPVTSNPSTPLTFNQHTPTPKNIKRKFATDDRRVDLLERIFIYLYLSWAKDISAIGTNKQRTILLKK